MATDDNKKSWIIKVWIKKEGPSLPLYTSDGEFTKLEAVAKHFPVFRWCASEDEFKKLEAVAEDFPVFRLYDSKDEFKTLKEEAYALPDVVIINNEKKNLPDSKFYPFRIALYETDALRTFNAHDPDADFFQKKVGQQKKKDEDKDKEFSPIIHILQKEGDIFLTDDFSPNAPRFRYITDSGIWNYLATDKEDFKNDVKEIKQNWEKGYYDLSIAREYAELNARLTQNSYLHIPTLGGHGAAGSTCGGHGAEVSPFLFHSETQIKSKIEPQDVFSYQWRFLLLDDKVDKDKEDSEGNKTGILSSESKLPPLTKADILRERIGQIPGAKCECVLAKKNVDDGKWHFYRDGQKVEEKKKEKTDDKEKIELPPLPEGVNIQIVCVETIEEACALMGKIEFDIILLDYLLDKDESLSNSPRAYGYQLLTKIYKREVTVELGPQGKLFFMFISAFTTAVNERLTLEGLSRDEEIWLIGEGACPTNTPELFKYRLLHLMKRRLDQTGIRGLSLQNILGIVKDIFSMDDTEEERILSVREKAHREYPRILELHYDYFRLRKNDEKKSILVQSFLKDLVHLGAMLEHLLQMVHLIAFGTVRQWPEIWEEYHFFIRTIRVKGDDDRKAIIEISKNIEQYIIELKSK